MTTTAMNNDTTLAALPERERLVFRYKNAPPIITTPRELMRIGRMPGFLTLDQVKFALSAIDYEENGHDAEESLEVEIPYWTFSMLRA